MFKYTDAHTHSRSYKCMLAVGFSYGERGEETRVGEVNNEWER